MCFACLIKVKKKSISLSISYDFVQLAILLITVFFKKYNIHHICLFALKIIFIYIYLCWGANSRVFFKIREEH